jgi:hypothetical protein
LRANGVEILQFVVGGAQGEVGITSALNRSEIPLPKLFPGGTSITDEPDACKNALEGGHPASDATSDEAFLSAIFSTRSLIRNIATPDFGDALLDLLNSSDLARPRNPNSVEGKVQRGAELFGIDLVAFANRTVGDGITATSDGRDLNAINQADRKLNCVGCHTPIHRTGQSPAATFSPSTNPTEVGAEQLSNVWAPIFSDLLLHKGPVIDAERFSPLPREVVNIRRLASNASTRGDNGDDNDRGDDSGRGGRRIFYTLDLPRSLADDTFNGQKAAAEGSEFRTAPLMALGRIGPPFMHDGRVYLSRLTKNRMPAGTVTTNRDETNAPLVVRTLDDALLAAIELHDLPAPDDRNTPRTPGAGCPVPDEVTNVSYGSSPKDAAKVICPAYDSAISQTHRSDAREVIYRFRQLSSDDQQAVIEFLKQL